MEYRKPDSPGAHIVLDLARPRGYELVDFSAEQVKQRLHVHCVLYHPDGVVLDSLGELHRALEPRLEELFGSRDLYVEFSSPGITRKFKSFHEFEVFTGKRVSILPVHDTNWITGTIQDADPQECRILDSSGETHTWHRDTVSRARLVD